MSDKKQTAVQWLVTQFNSNIDFIPIDKWDMIRDLLQQALQMEQEQIQDAYVTGAYIGRGDSKTYYEETYECQDEN